MLVSHRKKFIFLKTGKTAGTSVELYLEPWCLPEGEEAKKVQRDASVTEAGIVGPRRMQPDPNEKYFSHAKAAQLHGWIDEDIWSRYFKFAIARNPFSKVISWYHFRLDEPAKAELRHVAPDALHAHFRAWLAEKPILPRDFEYCTLDGEFALDFMMRFEFLRPDLRRVCEHLDIPFEPQRLQSRKSGYRSGFPDWPGYYDEASAEIVRQRYQWEFKTFGYAQDPSLGDAANPGLPFQL